MSPTSKTKHIRFCRIGRLEGRNCHFIREKTGGHRSRPIPWNELLRGSVLTLDPADSKADKFRTAA